MKANWGQVLFIVALFIVAMILLLRFAQLI